MSKLIYNGFNAKEESLREALTSTGNGYFCTRGAAPWCVADNDVHYPGTYLAGGYNRLITMIAKRPISNEDLVNFPNWLPLLFKIDDGDWFQEDKMKILNYAEEFDTTNALLQHSVSFEDAKGRQTDVVYRRFVHMGKMHQAAVELTVEPKNWEGKLYVKSAIDGSIINSGVARYRSLSSQHLEPLSTGEKDNAIYLLTRTTQSHVVMAQATITKAFEGDKLLGIAKATEKKKDYVASEVVVDAVKGGKYRFEKIVTVYTSRDVAITEPLTDALENLAVAGGFGVLLKDTTEAWKRLWGRCNISTTGDEDIQLNIRLHIVHVLQSCSVNSLQLDTAPPARGWTGEAYRGHIFWDELYIYPFMNVTIPEVTRSLLLYRYRRLDKARELANSEGFKGAMYPWQSSSNGVEETQIVHLNPKSGTWDPDLSRFQRHSNIAIAMCMWQYYSMTGDLSALSDFGAEVMLEIVRMFASMAHFNKERGRYEIHGVMGPDEYHEKFIKEPEKFGVRNNSYTNVMVAHLCDLVLKVLDIVPPYRKSELIADLHIEESELALWKDMSLKMYVCMKEGIMMQFEGFDELKPFDWDGYKKKYGNIQRLDRILKAEGDSPDHYQVSKQADTLMIFYVLSEPEVKGIFEQLGYFDSKTDIDEFVIANIKYHQARTCHGSTLSYLVHAALLARYKFDGWYDMLMTALKSDVKDVQGGTTAEGIHLGTMSGTCDILIRWLSGLEIRGSDIYFFPNPATALKDVTFTLLCRGNIFDISMNSAVFNVTLKSAHSMTIHVGAGGKVQVPVLEPNKKYSFTL